MASIRLRAWYPVQRFQNALAEQSAERGGNSADLFVLEDLVQQFGVLGNAQKGRAPASEWPLKKILTQRFQEKWCPGEAGGSYKKRLPRSGVSIHIHCEKLALDQFGLLRGRTPVVGRKMLASEGTLVDGIERRGRVFYMRRRMPTEFAAVGARKEIIFSLKTRDDDQARALFAVRKKRQEMKWWPELGQQSGEDSPDAFDAMVAS